MSLCFLAVHVGARASVRPGHADVPPKHKRHRVDPKHLEGVPGEQDHQCVEPAGAVVIEDRGADRSGVEEHCGQADGEQEPPESMTTVGADQQDVGRRVPEQPVADAENGGECELSHVGPRLVIATAQLTAEAAMNECPRGAVPKDPQS